MGYAKSMTYTMYVMDVKDKRSEHTSLPDNLPVLSNMQAIPDFVSILLP